LLLLLLYQEESRWLDCNLATEEEEDNFLSLEGWLSLLELRWNS
jgi:hypothetical protein